MLFLWSPYFSIFVLFFHLKLIILTAVRPPHVFIIFETIFPSIWPASINILINLSKRWIILPKKIYCTGGGNIAECAEISEFNLRYITIFS